MFKFLAFVAAVVFALSGMVYASGYPETEPVRVIVSDDDPRFDCRTMGNRVCGPGAQPHEEGGYW